MDLHTHVVEFEGEEPTRAHVLGAGYVERQRIAGMLNDLHEADGWGSFPHGYTGCSEGCFTCIRDWLLGQQAD